MPSTHKLKTWPEPFEDSWQETKPYEVRENDRRYGEGDELHLQEWDPETESYTGRAILARVTHVTDHRLPSPLPEGVVVLGVDWIDFVHDGSKTFEEGQLDA